jgi:hypothetical protein
MFFATKANRICQNLFQNSHLLSAVARFRGLTFLMRSRILGLRFAPPQALCCCPLRGLIRTRSALSRD